LVVGSALAPAWICWVSNFQLSAMLSVPYT
jgi:hypothetical protein